MRYEVGSSGSRSEAMITDTLRSKDAFVAFIMNEQHRAISAIKMDK